MSNKLDCDVFDSELALIKAVIANLESSDPKTSAIIQNSSSFKNSLGTKEVN
jgi:hypothetical protein